MESQIMPKKFPIHSTTILMESIEELELRKNVKQ